MIEITNLSKEFGPLKAVDNISFQVAPGQVMGFLGPNGAGKTTTMRMITGFLSPCQGNIKVCGYDVQENTKKAKEKIGYLPEGAPVYGDMTPWSFLNFIADIRKFQGSAKKQRIEETVAKLELSKVMHQNIDTLSKGFKRRVGLAQAILHEPDILILDEPTDGLDPNQKHHVRELIKKMAAQKTIIISTHILEEVEAICTNALIIAKGKIVSEGTPIAEGWKFGEKIAPPGGLDQLFRDITQA